MGASSPPRVAVVTGGTKGIGRAVAEALAAAGQTVVVNYAGDATAAGHTVAALQASGASALAVQADVADEVAVAAMFDTVEQAFGGVDVVVHSAGRMRLSSIAEIDLDELDSLHRTNIRGTVVVAQQAARRVRPGGAIITLSTSVLGLSTPTYGAYAASKGAVEALTLVLAQEMRGRDVTVNVVAPGPTATELFFTGKDQATIDRLAHQPPLQRLGTPADIAEVVAFLAGPGRWLHGQVLRVNGGLT
jgi:3-oxoacyl-[acyl-carrier protein] reductase